MEKVFSVEEIEKLLSAVAGGEEYEIMFNGDENADSSGKEIILNLYDFRRPDKVSKNQMRTMQNIHDAAARIMAESIGRFVKKDVEVEVVSVDLLTYTEFIMSISNPSSMHIVELNDFPCEFIFEMNPSLVKLLLAGHIGLEPNPEWHSSVLNTAAQKLILPLVEEMYASSWEVVKGQKPKNFKYESNPMFVQVQAHGDCCILITFEVIVDELKNQRGLMSICYPYSVAKLMLDLMDSDIKFDSKPEAITEATKNLMASQIKDIEIAASVVIAEDFLPFGKIREWKVGDIIKLNKSEEDKSCFLKLGRNCRLKGQIESDEKNKKLLIKNITEVEDE